MCSKPQFNLCAHLFSLAKIVLRCTSHEYLRPIFIFFLKFRKLSLTIMNQKASLKLKKRLAAVRLSMTRCCPLALARTLVHSHAIEERSEGAPLSRQASLCNGGGSGAGAGGTFEGATLSRQESRWGKRDDGDGTQSGSQDSGFLSSESTQIDGNGRPLTREGSRVVLPGEEVEESHELSLNDLSLSSLLDSSDCLESVNTAASPAASDEVSQVLPSEAIDRSCDGAGDDDGTSEGDAMGRPSREEMQVFSWGRGDLGCLLHPDDSQHGPLEALSGGGKCALTPADYSCSAYHGCLVTLTGEVHSPFLKRLGMQFEVFFTFASS